MRFLLADIFFQSLFNLDSLLCVPASEYKVRRATTPSLRRQPFPKESFQKRMRISTANSLITDTVNIFQEKTFNELKIDTANEK